VDLAFSGRESDQLVHYAELLLKASEGAIVPVDVSAREPITTTPIRFTGRLVGWDWKTYRRVILVRGPDSTLFEVGGSNSTRPLAGERIVFPNIPETVSQRATSEQAFESLSEDLTQTELDGLVLGLRVYQYSSAAKVRISDKLKKSLKAAKGSSRILAVRSLGLLRIESALTPLAEALDDLDPLVRREAALRLRAYSELIAELGEGHPSVSLVYKKLIERLIDPDSGVRTYATEDLGYYGGSESFEPLGKTLHSDPVDDVRWAAAIALGRSSWDQSAQLLLDQLRDELSANVRMACFLGLGRLASQLELQRSPLASKVMSTALQETKNSESLARDYSAFAVGEFRSHAANEEMRVLVEALSDARLQVKAAAAASLNKLIGSAKTTDETENLLRLALEIEPAAPPPHEWPSRAYYKWALIAMAELAAFAESHNRASAYYSLASAEFGERDWQSQYYKAMSFYEIAEATAAENVESSARSMEFCIQVLAKVEKNEGFLAASDDARSGLKLKQILARARLHMLQGIQLWHYGELSERDLTEIKTQFAQAANLYARLQPGEMVEKAKRLSPNEEYLVNALDVLAVLGQRAIDLMSAVNRADKTRMVAEFGKARARTKIFIRLARDTRSMALKDAALALERVLQATEFQKQPLLAERIYDFVHALRYCFQLPMPTPGNCPIVDFGHAKIKFARLLDVLSGAGSELDPFVVMDMDEVVLTVHVSDVKRTKNDRLYLTVAFPDSETTLASRAVTVHDDSFQTDLALEGLRAGRIAREVEVALEFSNRGCSQRVDATAFWLKVIGYHTASDPIRLQKRIQLEAEREILEKRILNLETKVATSTGEAQELLRNQLLRFQKSKETCEAQINRLN
jgi:HEAT repeat protein